MVTTPVCQSCAMSMEKAEDFGTNSGGSRNDEFCTHCFQEGSYTQPDATLDQMVGIVAGFMDMPEAEAKNAARESLASLGRWSSN